MMTIMRMAMMMNIEIKNSNNGYDGSDDGDDTIDDDHNRY